MIKLSNINKVINGEKILNNINLEIHKGEFLGIMGKSGSGKSTLLNILGLLDQTFVGNYYLNEALVNNLNDTVLSKIRGDSVGFVFQNFGLIDTMTIAQNLELPTLYNSRTKFDNPPPILSVLKEVGLDDKINVPIKKLSGGQRQRIAIGRALINNPQFLIADEPTGALDSETTKDILELFKSLNSQGVTILFVTHDASIASYFSRVIHMKDGEIIEETIND